MATTPKRIDPPDCGCNDCCTGWSRPFNKYGDAAQFHGLLHGEIQDACGAEPGAWMQTAIHNCPTQLAEFLADEINTGRLLSRLTLNTKIADFVTGNFDA